MGKVITTRPRNGGRRRCPECQRDVPTYYPTSAPNELRFKRHHLDPGVEPGWRDRCYGGGEPVKDGS